MKLYQFPHSPYVLRVKKLFDVLQIQYEPISLIPGLHMKILKKKGFQKTLVPAIDEPMLQGSEAIFEHFAKNSNLDVPNAIELEEKILNGLYSNLRILAYDRLTQTQMRQRFEVGLSRKDRWILRVIFPVVYPVIKKRYGVSPQNCNRAELELKNAFKDFENHEVLKSKNRVSISFEVAREIWNAIEAPN